MLRPPGDLRRPEYTLLRRQDRRPHHLDQGAQEPEAHQHPHGLVLRRAEAHPHPPGARSGVRPGVLRRRRRLPRDAPRGPRRGEDGERPALRAHSRVPRGRAEVRALREGEALGATAYPQAAEILRVESRESRVESFGSRLVAPSLRSYSYSYSYSYSRSDERPN